MIGRIGRAHGLRGEVSVDVRTDEPDRRFAAGVVVASTAPAHPTLTVQLARPHGSRWLLTFSEVSDRESADALRGSMLTLQVPSQERPDDPAEYYDHQLVGLRARTTGGDEVGTVEHSSTSRRRTCSRCVAAMGWRCSSRSSPSCRPEVDSAAGTLTIDSRPGLLDPEPLNQTDEVEDPAGPSRRDGPR